MLHPSQSILRRDRINKLLEEILSVPLTVICAPFGQGKTLALKGYQEAHPELQWFQPSILEAGREQFDFTEALNRLTFDVEREYAAAAPEKKKKTVFVIDDFYLIENEKMDFYLEFISRRQPPGLHLVILTRVMPRMNLSRLAMEGNCFLPEPAILDFTEEEIRQLMGMAGLAEKEEAARIYQETEGFAAAVCMAVRQLAQGGKRFDPIKIASILYQAPFEELAEEEQDALVRLSVLREFTQEEIDYVFQDRELCRCVAQLRSANGLLEYDSIHLNYRYRRLFLLFARRELMRSKKYTQTVLLRAARLLASKGELESAFHYFYGLGDPESILMYVERMEISGLIRMDHGFLEQVFLSIPAQLRKNYPLAFIAFCYVLILDGKNSLAQEVLDSVEGFQREVKDAPLRRSSDLAGEIALCRGICTLGDLQQPTDYYRIANEHLPGGSLLLNAKSNCMGAIPSMLYLIHRVEGSLKLRMLQACEAVESLNKVTGGLGFGYDYAIKAEYALFVGDLPQAQRIARKALYKGEASEHPDVIVASQLVLGQICILREDWVQLEQIAKYLEKLREETREYRIETAIEAVLLYLEKEPRKRMQKEQLLRNIDHEKNAIAEERRCWTAVSEGRTLILSGNYERIEVFCEHYLKLHSEKEHLLGMIYTYLYSAIAKENLYGTEAGMKEFRLAVCLAHGDGIILPFLENRQDLRKLIDMAHRSGSREENSEELQAFISRLAGLCGSQTASRSQKNAGRKQILSPREYQVLLLIEEGFKRKEISERLSVSLATVKTVIGSVYNKLGVNNRALAIKKAREMKILD